MASLGKDTIPVLDRALQLLQAVRDAELLYLKELQAEEDELEAGLDRDDCDNGRTTRPVPDNLTRRGR